MPTVTEILDSEFNSIKKELIEKYVELGMKASGKWAESLEVITQGTNTKILGEEYTKQLEDGRSSGGFPPIQAIRQWIIDKGIVNNIAGEISISSLAFLIARKIAREGWKRENHGGVNLVSLVITDKRIQSIIDLVGAEATISFTNILTEEFKQIEA